MRGSNNTSETEAAVSIFSIHKFKLCHFWSLGRENRFWLWANLRGVDKSGRGTCRATWYVGTCIAYIKDYKTLWYVHVPVHACGTFNCDVLIEK